MANEAARAFARSPSFRPRWDTVLFNPNQTSYEHPTRRQLKNPPRVTDRLKRSGRRSCDALRIDNRVKPGIGELKIRRISYVEANAARGQRGRANPGAAA